MALLDLFIGTILLLYEVWEVEGEEDLDLHEKKPFITNPFTRENPISKVKMFL